MGLLHTLTSLSPLNCEGFASKNPHAPIPEQETNKPLLDPVRATNPKSAPIAAVDKQKAAILKNFVDAKAKAKRQMLCHLDPNVRWNYCCFPRGVDPALAITKMRAFLESPIFDLFYTEFSESTAALNEKDVTTIGTDNLSPAAIRFLKCFDTLNAHEFYNVNGRPINFWSGMNARQKAYAAPSLSDSQIAAVSLGFDICSAVQEIEKINNQSLLSLFLPAALSSVFASQASGDVHVFMSSDKASELSGFQAGNHFWSSELPVLQRGRYRKSNPITKILVSFQVEGPTWTKPIDINSNASCLVLTRKLAYKGSPLLTDPNPERFYQEMDSQEFTKWCQTAAPRKQISLKTLRVCCDKFKNAIGKK